MDCIQKEEGMLGKFIGDGVNLASRLESACKQYCTKIMVSEFTVIKSQGTYRKREIGWWFQGQPAAG